MNTLLNNSFMSDIRLQSFLIHLGKTQYLRTILRYICNTYPDVYNDEITINTHDNLHFNVNIQGKEISILVGFKKDIIGLLKNFIRNEVLNIGPHILYPEFIKDSDNYLITLELSDKFNFTECPCCYEDVELKAGQCGHGICNDCYDKLRHKDLYPICPICRSPYFDNLIISLSDFTECYNRSDRNEIIKYIDVNHFSYSCIEIAKELLGYTKEDFYYSDKEKTIPAKRMNIYIK